MFHKNLKSVVVWRRFRIERCHPRDAFRGRVENPAGIINRRTLSTRTGRKPLPPMPRVVPPPPEPAVSDETKTPRRGGGGGGVLIATGWILLGLVTVDQILQYLDRTEARKTVAELQQSEDEARRGFYDQYKDQPVLHECIVRSEYKMSGTRGLKGVSLDDRLEVVEEGVGPNGSYAVCRRRDVAGNIASIGWYPVSFMEKVPRKKFLGIF